MEAILSSSFGLFLKLAWYFWKRFFPCDLIEGVGFCGIMIHISHCVPTRFPHCCCLPPFTSLCGPQDSRSVRSSAGQVFLACLIRACARSRPPSCTPLPQKKSREAEVSLIITTITRGRTKNLLCSEPQSVLVQIHFVFCFCCAFILPSPSGK